MLDWQKCSNDSMPMKAVRLLDITRYCSSVGCQTSKVVGSTWPLGSCTGALRGPSTKVSVGPRFPLRLVYCPIFFAGGVSRPLTLSNTQDGL